MEFRLFTLSPTHTFLLFLILMSFKFLLTSRTYSSQTAFVVSYSRLTSIKVTEAQPTEAGTFPCYRKEGDMNKYDVVVHMHQWPYFRPAQERPHVEPVKIMN
uniref:Uncharacterized protein n=1 Tax=Clastoptera arizonana TaxID=38151 RepID=A0A1B6C8L6_9HEMI